MLFYFFRPTGALTYQNTHHVFQGCPGDGGWHHAASHDLVHWEVRRIAMLKTLRLLVIVVSCLGNNISYVFFSFFSFLFFSFFFFLFFLFFLLFFSCPFPHPRLFTLRRTEASTCIRSQRRTRACILRRRRAADLSRSTRTARRAPAFASAAAPKASTALRMHGMSPWRFLFALHFSLPFVLRVVSCRFGAPRMPT